MKRVALFFITVFIFAALSGCATTNTVNAAGSSSTKNNVSIKKQSVRGEDFINPLGNEKFYLTSLFGPRIDPITYVKKDHNGIDLACTRGTPIYAAKSGVVDIAGWHQRYGNYVVIIHPDGYKSLYAHMSKINTKQGKNVEQGEKIGEVGSTGYSTGNHLHLTVYKDKNLVDPLPLALKNETVTTLLSGKKTGLLYFINPTTFRFKGAATSVDLDIYFTTKEKIVSGNTVVNYTLHLGTGITDYEPFFLSFECFDQKLSLKDVNVLYTELEDESDKKVYFTAALSEEQMKILMSCTEKDKIYLTLKYGTEKEQRVYSKNFNQKILQTRLACEQ